MWWGLYPQVTHKRVPVSKEAEMFLLVVKLLMRNEAAVRLAVPIFGKSS